LLYRTPCQSCVNHLQGETASVRSNSFKGNTWERATQRTWNPTQQVGFHVRLWVWLKC